MIVWSMVDWFFEISYFLWVGLSWKSSLKFFSVRIWVFEIENCFEFIFGIGFIWREYYNDYD